MERSRTVQTVVELRQYTLRPGGREVLIDLFDSTLVEPQEDAGMSVLGQFRDLDDPDRFVWLRGFPTMDERARRLAAFYDGPVWRAHRDAANATMLDSDDVLLLRPARPDSAFALDGATRAGSAGRVDATIAHLASGDDVGTAVSFFEEEIVPAIGGTVLGYFVTEHSENTFPRLPVREGENVLAWFVGYADGSPPQRANAEALDRPLQVLRLEPTARSLLDGRTPACRAGARAAAA